MTAFNSKIGRLPADDRRPGADADAGDPGRARGEDPRVPCRATTGRCTARFAPPAASTTAAGSTRTSRRPTTTPTRAPSASGTRRAPRADRSQVRGQAGHRSPRRPSRRRRLSPLLYDLTSLQREANGRFGFSARTTLSLAQALYEKHKVLTYPRTDSRALPEDYLATVKATLEVLARIEGILRYSPGQVLKDKWVKPEQAHLRQRQGLRSLRDHPDAAAPKSLTELEAKLYDMVVKRFLAVFYPAAEFLVTTRITRVEGEPFKTEGKVLVSRRAGSRSTARRRRRRRRRRSLPVKPNETRRDGGNRGRGQRDAAAGALHRSDAALGDGRRGQADRRRRAARGDARKGPRHAGDARADHRRPDLREVHPARRARAAAHREGVLADDAAARPRRCPSCSRPSSPANGNSSSRRWSTASSSASSSCARSPR